MVVDLLGGAQEKVQQDGAENADEQIDGEAETALAIQPAIRPATIARV